VLKYHCLNQDLVPDLDASRYEVVQPEGSPFYDQSFPIKLSEYRIELSDNQYGKSDPVAEIELQSNRPRFQKKHDLRYYRVIPSA
jgi:hypothetical protein